MAGRASSRWQSVDGWITAVIVAVLAIVATVLVLAALSLLPW